MKNSPILITKKPFWWKITGKEWGTVAMTWGRYIYCADDKVTDDILVHELVHVEQHKGKWIIAFWHLIKSTFNDKFYQQQENEALTIQLDYLSKDENYRNNGRRTKGKIYREITKRI